MNYNRSQITVSKIGFNRCKAHRRYEFGCKVGIAATNREGFMLAACAFGGTLYDGHTLQATLDQVVRTGGVAPTRQNGC